MNNEQILIAGCGIAGATLGINFARQKIPFHIIDAATQFNPIGAGVNLLPHAVEVADELGLLSNLGRLANEIKSLSFITCDGKEIHKEQRGRSAGHKYPQLAIHRGILHQLLLDCLQNQYDISVERGVKLIDFTQDDDVLHVQTDNNNGSNLPPKQFRALVGCDGIKSATRANLFPREGAPVSGEVEMWRGVSINPGLELGSQMFLIGSLEDLKLVIYPIGSVDGREHVNWVLERKLHSTDEANADWSECVEKNALVEIVKQSRISCINVESLINSSENVLYFEMVDRDPLPQWSFDRVTLLGDAAHPMYPFGSNGACQAILDTEALCQALKSESGVAEAYEKYDFKRRYNTNNVVRLNRKCPPDAILEIVDQRLKGRSESSPSAVISLEEINYISSIYKATAGFSLRQA